MANHLRSLAIAGAMTVVVAAPTRVFAQTEKTQTTAAAAANPFATPPGVKRVPVSRAVFGDAGMIINARDDGFIEVAAAGSQKTIALKLRALAARSWIDSTLRMMKARVKKADPPRTFRSEVQEFGTGTTMALTRSVNAGESAYALAFSENPQSQFSVAIEPEEADVFVAIMRKAEVQATKMLEKTDTTAARADSAAKADSIAKAQATKKKRPAAKRPAPPPAVKDSTSKTPAPKPTAPAKPSA